MAAKLYLALALGALCGLVLPVLADEASIPALPTFASSPLLNPETTNSWSGLVAGSELFVFSQKGAKGHVGGDGFVGYRHEFDNNLVVGVQASAGFAPRPARVRRLPDAETKLVRRQGTAGPHLEDGQS